jgi:hypothetical protein
MPADGRVDKPTAEAVEKPEVDGAAAAKRALSRKGSAKK